MCNVREHPRERSAGSQVVIGIIFIVVGGLLILDRSGMIEIGGFWRLWPLFLIGMGLSRLLERPRSVSGRKGVMLVTIGTWLLLNQLEVLSWDTSWPLLLIGLGISIVWESLARQPASPSDGEN